MSNRRAGAKEDLRLTADDRFRRVPSLQLAVRTKGRTGCAKEGASAELKAVTGAGTAAVGWPVAGAGTGSLTF